MFRVVNLLFYYFRILDSENALTNGSLHDTRFASLLLLSSLLSMVA